MTTMTQQAVAAEGTAVVTGASSGIGAAFARALAREGYNLILHGRREDLLRELCVELREIHGIHAEYLVADLGEGEGLRRLEERIRQTSTLALLVNNAGFGTTEEFREADIEQQEAMIRVHVLASVRLAHAAIPAMLTRRQGAIINVASVAGFMISPANVTYCATKAYLINFSESLHLELRASGIRVQALCPGFTTTDFHQRLGYDMSDRIFRYFGTAESVVEDSLKALRRGKVICIPGVHYRLMVQAVRFIPRWLFYRLVAIFAGRNPVRNAAARKQSVIPSPFAPVTPPSSDRPAAPSSTSLPPASPRPDTR